MRKPLRLLVSIIVMCYLAFPAVIGTEQVELQSLAIRIPIATRIPLDPQLSSDAAQKAIAQLRQKNLLMPVPGTDIDSLKGSFYERRGSGLHRAVDILAPRHTAVVACDNGHIAKLFCSKAGGTTIYQYDPSGQFIYYYAHLERYAEGLKEGDKVVRGQVIGYVGTSGNAPPNTPHLHFSISLPVRQGCWYPSAPVDPYEVFKNSGARKTRLEIKSFVFQSAYAAGAQRKAVKTATSGSFKNGKLTLGKTIPVNGYHPGEPVVVIVDKTNHRTYVLQKQRGNRVVKVFSAANATGAARTPSPYGRFTVVHKLKWPSWIPPKTIDKKQKAFHPYNKDRKNPLGIARISLNKWDMVLHGTNDPASIRKNISHGCIRHSNNDIMTIFNMVKVGTPVYIVNQFRGKTISASDFAG